MPQARKKADKQQVKVNPAAFNSTTIIPKGEFAAWEAIIKVAKKYTKEKKYGVDEPPKKKMTGSEIARAIQTPPKPKLDAFNFLLKQWQFWALVIILIATLAFAIISDNIETVNKQSSEQTEQKQAEQKQTEPENFTSIQYENDVARTIGGGTIFLIKHMDIIILVLVLGFILSVFFKLFDIFK